MYHDETIKTEKGNAYTFTRIDSDVNGNPRYIVHWLNLGLEDYASTKATRQAGLTKYRGKRYGGGFVCQSYSLQGTAIHFEKCGLYPKNDTK